MNRGWFPFLCALLLLGHGCTSSSDAPDIIPVTGVVTMGGKPAADMNITFSPESGGAPSYAKTDQDGTFKLTYNDGRMGAIPVAHKVTIVETVLAVATADDPATEKPVRTIVPKEKSFDVVVSPQQNFFQFSLD